MAFTASESFTTRPLWILPAGQPPEERGCRGEAREDEHEPKDEAAPRAAQGASFFSIALEADGPGFHAALGEGAALAAYRTPARGARTHRLP